MTNHIRVVLVKHYLSAEGFKFLKLSELSHSSLKDDKAEAFDPKTLIEKLGWIGAVRALIKHHQSIIPEVERGFISIEFETDENDSELLKIDLRFKNETTLKNWLDFPPHQTLLEALDCFRTKDWQWAAFNLEEKNPLSLDQIRWHSVEV